MLKNKFLFITLVTLISTLFYSVCTGSKSIHHTAITIGGVFGLTGYASFAGEASHDGFIMAIEDSGISSSTIHFVVEDTHSELKSTVSAVNKLISVDHAAAIIGPEWTEFGEVVAPIIENARVPTFSPWVVAEAPFVKKPYFWSITPSDRSEHIALASYIASQNLKRISLIYSKNFWSEINIRMFKEEAAKAGLQVVSEYGLDQSTTDFRTTLSKIKAENPDIIYSVVATDDGHVALLKQIQELGLSQKIATHSGRITSGVIKDRARNLLSRHIFAEMDHASRAEEFSSKYEKRFGKKVGAQSAAAAYDATTIVIKAIQAGAKDSGDIIKFIQNMASYEGYSGTIEFDVEGKLPIRKALVKGFDSTGKLIELSK